MNYNRIFLLSLDIIFFWNSVYEADHIYPPNGRSDFIELTEKRGYWNMSPTRLIFRLKLTQNVTCVSDDEIQIEREISAEKYL